MISNPLISLTLLLILAQSGFAQEKRKHRFPIGTYHYRNQNITGISVGIFSGHEDEPRNVQTNGIRLEAIGMGLLVPLIPRSPVLETEEAYQATMSSPPSELINGFNLSPAGTVSDGNTNGISAGIIGQIGRRVNGISLSVMMNFAQSNNGVQVAMFNDTYAMNGLQVGLSNSSGRARGLQIGLVNHSGNLKGIQLGLWNVNQKRKFPIFNWNFNN